MMESEAVLGDENATEEDGNSEDDDKSFDDDSDEDLFNNEYMDGGDEQSCGVSEFAKKVNSTFSVTFKNDANLSPNNSLGNIDKVELDVVVEDSFINDKSYSTNKVGNQVNNQGLVAVSPFPNGSQSSPRDICGSKEKNHFKKIVNLTNVVGPANLNKIHHGPD
ncbi:hypothetical protein Tco_0115541 [Tanacetum coccineum]